MIWGGLQALRRPVQLAGCIQPSVFDGGQAARDHEAGAGLCQFVHRLQKNLKAAAASDILQMETYTFVLACVL